MNIYNHLVTTATTWPNKVAIVDAFGELTYEKLLSETIQLKDELIRAGIRKGNGVGIHTKNNRHFVMTLYAALGCDAIAMPIGHQQTEVEINNAIQEANLHFVVSEKSDLNDTSVSPAKTFHHPLLFLFQTERNLQQPTVDFIDHPALMRFTSGTTGTAKCVILSHQSVRERMEAANQGLQLSNQDRVIWVLPMAYHFIVSIMLYVYYGVGIIVCDDFLAEAVIEKANTYDATVMYASPLHIRLLATQKKEIRFASLKKIISTTTAISRDICQMFSQRYRLPVMQAFGIIEVGLPIINLEKSEEHPEAVGRALPAYEISILDEEFNPLPHEQIGLLGIKGPGMFDGYLKPPLPRNAILKNGMFITGDYAVQSADGLITIRGRAKAMINVSGNKVFPDEVEDVLLRYPGVVHAKVSGQTHLLLGEMVVAELVLQDEAFDEEDIINHCRKYLSSFKVPQRITAVSAISMTDSGKIKRT